MNNKKILDVGCGPCKTQNSIGVDQVALPGVDVVCNLNQPWPFKARSFHKIIFRHSINHFDNLEFILRETKRVANDGALIEIIAPHFSSDNIFTDPTVKFFLGYRSLNYYCYNTTSSYQYYSDLKFHLIKRKIYLYKSQINGFRDQCINGLLYPLEWLINKFPRLYEKFFCFIFRANEITFTLRNDDLPCSAS